LARKAWSSFVLAAVLVLSAALPGSRIAVGEAALDDFERLGGWTTNASDGATVSVSQDPGYTGFSLRIDFDLPKDGGWIIVRRSVDLSMPENYAFSYRIRGQAPQNNFEFKLVDPTGKNVWWRVQRDFTFPSEWQLETIRKARIVVAWGSPPTPGKVGAIEFAISTGDGGTGTVWIDDLRFEKREPASQYRRTAKVTASSSLPDHEAAFALDPDRKTKWRSLPKAEGQWLLVDFVRERDYGGLVIDWDPLDYAVVYRVEVSDDAEKWTTAFVQTRGRGGRDFVYMPDAESRYVRLTLEQSSRGEGYGIPFVAVQPLEFSDTPNRFFQAMAAESAPGRFPKYLYGKQTYWTVIGVDGGEKNALLNEEGQLEVEKGMFSVEPFLHVDGKLVDWASVRTSQQLEDSYLPIPSVTWDASGFSLRVTAFAAGDATASTLYAQYRVENRGEQPMRATLFLAFRPFQVNPPWQSLNMVGGFAPIRDIRFDGGVVWLNRDKLAIPLRAPDSFGATSLEQGQLTDFLGEGRVPPQPGVRDLFGFSSAALAYELNLAPGQSTEVGLAIPFQSTDVTTLPPPSDVLDGHERLEDTKRRWQERLGHVDIEVPAEARHLVDVFKTTLAYTLINRDGPRLQPGPRNYARSWIRDGALTSATLLASGFTDPPREFLDWFARYQLPDGKVPCCVDRRGADPVIENDSDGEFIYAVAEVYRYTRDIGFVSELWPKVVKAVEHLESLRVQRTTEAFRAPDKLALFGLLPASISHEGYSAQPQHSYWDDFFALRGLKDAASLASAMGDDERAHSYAALRDAFRTDLYASIGRTIEQHGIDYLPGSAELGDFDPSSTAVALDPGGEAANLPRGPLKRTFAKYYQLFRDRRDGARDWDNFSPYEVRIVDAMVRLGMRDQALEVLDYMVASQRPAAWNQWPEVIWRDATEPRFIGDMPHTWVGSGFIRSLRTLFVYERESDHALVLAAGVPSAWVTAPSGVTVRRLPTPFGTLGYSLKGDGPERLHLRLFGDLRVPPGNLIVRPPLERPLRAVSVNGQPIKNFSADEAMISEFPADVVFEVEPAAAPTALPQASPR
jgi:F5/8 type C domain